MSDEMIAQALKETGIVHGSHVPAGFRGGQDGKSILCGARQVLHFV